MATVSVTNHAVFPTNLDIHGGSAGNGTVWTEQSAGTLLKLIAMQRCFVLSGFDPVGTGGTLTKTINGGVAVIDGYLVKGTGGNNITFDASTTNHLYLQLVVVAGVVTAVQLVTNTTGVKPANSVKLMKVVTSGSAPTAVTDERAVPQVIYGKVRYPTGGGTLTLLNAGSANWSISGANVVFASPFGRIPTSIYSGSIAFAADADQAGIAFSGSPGTNADMAFLIVP